MFKGWDNFYLLVGGASGSLIGLLFIVATLFSGRDRDRMLKAATVYTTPTVFNLTLVVILSAAALAPSLSALAVGDGLALASLIGLARGGHALYRFRTLNAGDKPHWSDLWCYCIAPLALYALLAVCAGLTWMGRAGAATAIACTVLLFLVVAIRNAWDLVTWMSPRRPGES